MVDLLTELNAAHRESPSWRLYGLCHQAASRITELEAKVERLTKERDDLQNRHDSLEYALDGIKARSEALSRTGAVKVDRQRLNIEISKWATDSDLHITIGDVEALHEAILSALEPAAPEGEQEAVATVAKVNAAGASWNTVYPADALDKLPIGTPLYTRPAKQAVTEAMVERFIGVYETECRHRYDRDAIRAALKAAMEAG